MRKIAFVIIVFHSVFANSQIEDTIEVNFMKSAYMLFDDEAPKYDVGSEDVLIRTSGNKLILQASVENFEETNLLVEANGVVRIFIIKYSDSPKKYLYRYEKNIDSLAAETIQKNKKFSDSVCEVLLMRETEVLNRGMIKYKLGVYLRDYIYYEGRYYFKFSATNKSNIPYNIDYFSMDVINVKKRIKGESRQSIKIVPVGFVKMPEVIFGKTSINFVVVVDPFVMTENKKLRVELWEKNGKDLDFEGGRKVHFDLYYKDVLNLKKL